jgi:hypothetical protein
VSRLRMEMLLSALLKTWYKTTQSSSLNLGKTRLPNAWSPCLRHSVDASLTLLLVTQIQPRHNVVTICEPSHFVHRKVNSLTVMPPKKRRRTDTPQSSPSAEPTTPDLDSWPGWCEIESEPVCYHLVPQSSESHLHVSRPSLLPFSKILVFAISEFMRSLALMMMLLPFCPSRCTQSSSYSSTKRMAVPAKFRKRNVLRMSGLPIR